MVATLNLTLSWARTLTLVPLSTLPESTKEMDTMSFFTQRSQVVANLTSAVVQKMAQQPIQDIIVMLGTVGVPESWSAQVTKKVERWEQTDRLTRTLPHALVSTRTQ